MRFILLYLFFGASPLMKADSSVEPTAIIQQDGYLNFSDGSSIYTFKKDGTFSLQPVGEGGRTVEGKWHKEQGLFVIEGRWSWINGISERDDYRIMKLGIFPIDTTAKQTIGIAKTPVSHCYFEIEELTKKHP